MPRIVDRAQDGMSLSFEQSTQRHARSALVATAVAVSLLFSTPAAAQRIEHKKAVFAALDKVTARISKLEVEIGKTAKFGALRVTPRACYSRSPTEPPKTTSFVEIQEQLLNGKEQRVFNGWMFAQSPGLNALEHPVYDLWLTDCGAAEQPVAASKGRPGQASSSQDGDDAPSPAQPPARRRPRR